MARRAPPKPAAVRRPARTAQTRQERARETRARMCDAAEELFRERGYSATTMAQIAKRAGVAVQTVYFTFRTKGLLFLDVLVRVGHGKHVAGAAEKPAPAFTHKLFEETDPQRQLAILVEHGHDFIRAFAPVWPFVQIAAEGDPEFTARFQAIVDERRRGIGRFFEALAARGALRVPAAHATDTFFLLANPELQSLSSGPLRWPLERYKAWTWELAVTQLLRDAKPKRAAVAGLSFASALSTEAEAPGRHGV